MRFLRRRRVNKTGEASQARVVRNTLANTGGSLVTVIVGLLLSPFMIHQLGTEAYGVWILATTLTFGAGYLSFADLGFEQAAVRYIAEARSDRDLEEMNRIWMTTLALLTVIPVLLVTPLVILTPHIVGIFAVPDDLHDEAVLAFAFVIGQLLFELPGRAFAALLEGSQRYGWWQIVRIIQTLLISGGVVTVLITGGGIAWVGAATFGAQGVILLVTMVLALTQVEGARFAPSLISKVTGKKLASFGGQLIIFRILSAIYRPMDQVIIGIALTASAVTTYEIGNKLYMAAALIQSVATSALIPATAFSRDEPQRLRELLLRGTNYTVALALPFAVAAIIFAEPLIRTWIGPEHVDSAGPAQLLLAALVPGFTIVVGQTMLVALGVLRPMIVMVTGWTLSNLVISIALVGPLGIEGPIIATLVSTTLLMIPVTWLFLKEIQVSLAEWSREVFLPVVPGVIAQTIVGLGLLQLANRTDSLVLVALLAGVSIAASLGGWFYFGLSATRRAEVEQLIRETTGMAPSTPADAPSEQAAVAAGATAGTASNPAEVADDAAPSRWPGPFDPDVDYSSRKRDE